MNADNTWAEAAQLNEANADYWKLRAERAEARVAELEHDRNMAQDALVRRAAEQRVERAERDAALDALRAIRPWVAANEPDPQHCTVTIDGALQRGAVA